MFSFTLFSKKKIKYKKVSDLVRKVRLSSLNPSPSTNIGRRFESLQGKCDITIDLVTILAH